MARRTKETNATAPDVQLIARRRKLAWPIAALLLAAAASNAYLGVLYVEVRLAAGHAVDSFCAISAGFNCVSVAQSDYATVLGVPLALFGFEYYALALFIVAASALGWWRVRAWDSLVFWMMVAGLPVSILMAWISATEIRSICLMCTAVYTVNVLALVVLLVAHRGRLKAFVGEGPAELLRALSASKAVKTATASIVVVGFSQLLWAPPLFGSRVGPGPTLVTMENPWKGIDGAGSSLGRPDAPIVIEDFSDFECPVCRTGHERLIEIMKRWPDKVRLKHFDFPLDRACNRELKHDLHVHACEAASYARCAGKQGKFWPFEALLFHNQTRLKTATFEAIAKEVELDAGRLATCLKSDDTKQGIAQDLEEGIRRKIRGTPTYFINGERVQGPRPMSFWQEKIEAILNKKSGDGS